MSAASARAEARRKAILSRGSDRLSKLTTSARGEDHPVYTNVDPLPGKAPTTETFIGEESILPTPPARANPSPAPSNTSTAADAPGPSAWSTEQQQEFVHALMSAPEVTGAPSAPQRPFAAGQAPLEPSPEAGDDPMAAILSALTQMTGQAPPSMGGPGSFGAMNMNMSGMAPQATETVPRSMSSKLRPLLHLLASWMLLAFFAFSMEPKAYATIPGSHVTSTWERWAELGWRSAREPFGVQPVPFFWAFTTLQLVLHSIQIFAKSNPIQPPALLALALPALPPPLRSLITNVLAYVRMGGMLLDDVAGLVLGIGILIWVAGWIVDG